MYVGCSYDSNGRRYKTNQGLTQLIQDSAMRRNKSVTATSILKFVIYQLPGQNLTATSTQKQLR